MAKIKATELAKLLKMEFLTVMSLVDEYCEEDQVTGKGKNTWLNEEAKEKIIGVAQIPEIIPEYYMGRVTHEAENPNYVYTFIKELKKRVPTVIQRRFRGRLLGKNIKVEEIKDTNGSTFRYIPQRFNT